MLTLQVSILEKIFDGQLREVSARAVNQVLASDPVARIWLSSELPLHLEWRHEGPRLVLQHRLVSGCPGSTGLCSKSRYELILGDIDRLQLSLMNEKALFVARLPSENPKRRPLASYESKSTID